MHLKRNEMIRTLAMRRKGTKYIVRSRHNLRSSIPLLVILRNIFKIAENRKEAKKILNSNKIKVNNKTTKEEKFPLSLFDILSIDDKNYRIVLKNKKFGFAEISSKEAFEKIAKVIGKKIMKKARVQVNLSDGRNYIVKEKIKTGDSAVIDLKENKIFKILKLEEGCKVMFIAGKRLGREGIAEKINEKNIVVNAGEKINAKLENLIVVGEK